MRRHRGAFSILQYSRKMCWAQAVLHYKIFTIFPSNCQKVIHSIHGRRAFSACLDARPRSNQKRPCHRSRSVLDHSMLAGPKPKGSRAERVQWTKQRRRGWLRKRGAACGRCSRAGAGAAVCLLQARRDGLAKAGHRNPEQRSGFRKGARGPRRKPAKRKRKSVPPFTQCWQAQNQRAIVPPASAR